MNVITNLVQPEPTSSPERSRGVEHVSQHAIAGLRAPLETELSGIIDRLLTGAVAEADAAVERARAAGQIALEAAQADLEELTWRHDGLNESLLQSEIQVEELRLTLQVERENTKARDAYETEQIARARAEAANEAQAVREQIVSAYESRLLGVQAELDAMRAELIGLEQQLEVEASERARLIAAFKTVQQACVSVEPQADTHVARVPVEKRHGTTSNAQDQSSAKTHDDCAPENDVTQAAVQTRDDETPDPTTPGSGRSLKLVAPSEVAPVAAPPQLVAYLKELFEKINAMYWVDRQAHASVEVVDRLSANLRHARDVFVQRASSEGVIGAKLFEQELCARLYEVDATSLGRHLGIAAYELTRAGEAHLRAEAS